MIVLYDSAFSPFARKVRIVLEHKAIAHEVTDGLIKGNHGMLQRVNGRVEVPALEHDGLLVVGSADIVAYLERVFPQRPIYPVDPAEWVRARAWERCADTLIDAILTDISYWTWAERDDAMPDGLRAAARRDLDQVYAALERDLSERQFLCGEQLSIAEIALFPHLVSTRSLGVSFDRERFPQLMQWFARLRRLEVLAADVRRAKSFLAAGALAHEYERRKIFWRGDRLEWLLARGHHQWLVGEIEADRVLWPGLALPAPR